MVEDVVVHVLEVGSVVVVLLLDCVVPIAASGEVAVVLLKPGLDCDVLVSEEALVELPLFAVLLLLGELAHVVLVVEPLVLLPAVLVVLSELSKGGTPEVKVVVVRRDV
jgi:hypothetical protein